MELIGILLGGGLVVFFLFVVPWFAISARREALSAKAQIDLLRTQVAALGRVSFVAPEAPIAETTDDTKPKAATRKPAAVAKTSAAPAVSTSSEPPTVSPWTMPQAASGLMRDAAPTAASDTSPAPAAAAAAPPTRDYEELIGTRWAIWVGGLALALGALFLVRYTIEAGVFGPGARLAMGGAFSLALVAAGELLRRGAMLPRLLRDAPLPKEHAPLALTAAGVVGLFGTVYAAHAVYGFIPQAAAFLLMAIIGIGAMAASLVHGQALAGLGLIASYATPVLIGGESRNRWPLVVFLLAVTAAGLGLQSRLRTIWLGWAIVAGVAAWSGALALFQSPDAAAELVFIVGSLALFAGALLRFARPRYAATPVGDPLQVTALAGLSAAMGLSFVSHSGPSLLHVIAGLAGIAIVLLTVARDGRAGIASIGAALLPLGMILTWPSITSVGPIVSRVLGGAFFLFGGPPREASLLGLFAGASGGMLAIGILYWFLGKIPLRSPLPRPSAMALAVVGGLAAPVLVFAWTLRLGGLAQNLPAALILATVAVALAAATRMLLTPETPAGEKPAAEASIGAGGYAAGAALAAGLSIALALPGLWMAVGFAAAALGVAALNDRMPLPMLRRIAAAFATTAMLRALLSPVHQAEGAWPVVNSYIVALAAPAAMLAATGWLLARTKRDRPLKTVMLDAAALAAIYLAYTIRHGFHGANLVDGLRIGLGESGLFALAALGSALALHHARNRWPRYAARLKPSISALNIAGLVLIALLTMVAANPWIQGRISGPPIIDSTFVGLVAPALVLGVLAYLGRTLPLYFSDALTRANRGVAIGLGFLYALAQTRLTFVGQERFIRAYTSQAEQYAYSAVTLTFGVLLLVIGFRLGSKPTRLASGIFVTIAVLKVFLYDLSELQGLLRALSFIGLGAVLIGIGLAYQRLLFDKKPEASLAADEPRREGVVA
jgi:uncharacterized membrane protein